MNPDALDILLRLAFLEGVVVTHGAYEHAVMQRPAGILKAGGFRRDLEERLIAALESATPAAPVTVGSYLRDVRSARGLQAEEISRRIGLTGNIYRLLERDRISPLRIPVDAWRKFRRLFNLPAGLLEEMVRRTHQLVFFSPSFRATLARYDGRGKKTGKAAAMEQGARELFSKAGLSLPPEEKKKVDDLVKRIMRD